jgi:hypothetical protein
MRGNARGGNQDSLFEEAWRSTEYDSVVGDWRVAALDHEFPTCSTACVHAGVLAMTDAKALFGRYVTRNDRPKSISRSLCDLL